MASRSCRRKSGSSVDREEAARLLRDGAVTRDPSPALLKAAKRLEKPAFDTRSHADGARVLM